MIIISFAGRAQTGKDTSAAIMREYITAYRPQARIETLAWADVVKQDTLERFLWKHNYTMEDLNSAEVKRDYVHKLYGLDDDEAEEFIGMTVRDVINHSSDTRKRETYTQVYFDKSKESIAEFDKDGVDYLLITDTRFPYESEFVLGDTYAETYQIVLTREGIPKLEHHSENTFDSMEYDWKIQQDETFTVADLRKFIEFIGNSILGDEDVHNLFI